MDIDKRFSRPSHHIINEDIMDFETTSSSTDNNITTTTTTPTTTPTTTTEINNNCIEQSDTT